MTAPPVLQRMTLLPPKPRGRLSRKSQIHLEKTLGCQGLLTTLAGVIPRSMIPPATMRSSGKLRFQVPLCSKVQAVMPTEPMGPEVLILVWLALETLQRTQTILWTHRITQLLSAARSLAGPLLSMANSLNLLTMVSQ